MLLATKAILSFTILHFVELNIVTKEDLEIFRLRLLADLKQLVASQQTPPARPEGYRTADVRKMLGCSVNKLVSIRVSRKLRTKKIGGTLYYNPEDIHKLLNDGFNL